ncbi:MAG: FAD-dependent oxidoreductase [Clostridia bacterium]
MDNKSGRESYAADMFVDATGDGDLLYCAGVPTQSRGNYHVYYGRKVTLDTCRTALETGDIGRAFTSACGGNSLYGNRTSRGMPLATMAPTARM